MHIHSAEMVAWYGGSVHDTAKENWGCWLTQVVVLNNVCKMISGVVVTLARVCIKLTLPSSTRLLTMTIREHFICQTMRHMSFIVYLFGPTVNQLTRLTLI